MMAAAGKEEEEEMLRVMRRHRSQRTRGTAELNIHCSLKTEVEHRVSHSEEEREHV